MLEQQKVEKFRAPFPYFGGKSRAQHLIWPRLGDVQRYVEAFAGSLAVLLSRPHEPREEVVNDLDCMIANFWRSLTFAPEAVADFADWPMNEADVHARHLWLVNQVAFRERMMTDPDYYDPKIAGWWAWGKCAWIAGGWCDFDAISKTTGRMGRSIPSMGGGRGILSDRIQKEGIQEHFTKLARRLRNVHVVCGDWSRVLTPSALGPGLVGVVLDPPYAGESEDIYTHGSHDVSGDVRRWAIENGNNSNYRIALCGYEGEHQMPEGWEKVSWKASGGYGSQSGTNVNAERERIWFSKACLKPSENLNFDSEETGDDE